MEEIGIIKKGGSQEPWSDDKLVISIAKAGVPLKEAENYAEKLKNWARQNSNNKAVKSSELRDQVIEIIKPSYPAEAESYKTYKQ